MLTRLATVILFVLPAVIAIPTYGSSSGSSGSSGSSSAPSCTTGEVMCCNGGMEADPSHNPAGLLSGLLGVVLGGINIPIQVHCVPGAGIGGSSDSCTGQVACCTNNDGSSLVDLECVPINISG